MQRDEAENSPLHDWTAIIKTKRTFDDVIICSVQLHQQHCTLLTSSICSTASNFNSSIYVQSSLSRTTADVLSKFNDDKISVQHRQPTTVNLWRHRYFRWCSVTSFSNRNITSFVPMSVSKLARLRSRKSP